MCSGRSGPANCKRAIVAQRIVGALILIKTEIQMVGKGIEDVGGGVGKFLNEFSGPFPFILPEGFPGAPRNPQSRGVPTA